jgi:dihydroflavonol-4-reductase
MAKNNKQPNNESKTNKNVLLTGVTGFLGAHTTIQLLEQGYEVTGTMRNLKKADHIRNVIGKYTSHTGHLHFAEADLMDEDVWDTLMPGMNFVQHIASPFPQVMPKHEDELIIPAKKGTLNILRAASAHGVQRVVMTSSSGAMMYGREANHKDDTYDESDWTDIRNKKDTTPYLRSKTIAEKAAWDYIAQNNSGMELVTVCPGAILGPVLEKDSGTSAAIVIKLMDGSMPGLPDLRFDIVDVRSIADLLLRAMQQPEAANERFAGSAGFCTLKDIAEMLQDKYPGRKIPIRMLPNFIVRIFSYFETSLKPVLLDLGAERKIDSTKAQQQLGWRPRSKQEAVLACAESAVNLQLA